MISGSRVMQVKLHQADWWPSLRHHLLMPGNVTLYLIPSLGLGWNKLTTETAATEAGEATTNGGSFKSYFPTLTRIPVLGKAYLPLFLTSCVNIGFAHYETFRGNIIGLSWAHTQKPWMTSVSLHGLKVYPLVEVNGSKAVRFQRACCSYHDCTFSTQMCY